MSQPATEMRYGGRFHQDDRGIRYCDIFPYIGKGDINVSVIEPGAAALWHRHMYQDDYQIVIKGSLKVGVCNAPYMGNDDMENFGMSEQQATEIYEERSRLLDNWKSLREVNNLDGWPEDEGKVEWHYLSERNANEGPLFIPRHLWHGCYNYTNEPAILIYHITNKYDGDDEDRLDPFIAGWPYEREVK
jgi:hypothetical protein